jgi:rod shape-determining protein MreC
MVLLIAYFGEPTTSPLHPLQRGIAEAFSPIAGGADKVSSPVRAAVDWVSDTIHAKSRADELQKKVDRLQAELGQAEAADLLNRQLRREVKLDEADNVASYAPLTADVIDQNPTRWYQQIEVDKGAADGVRQDDPVLGDGGLVGKVGSVGPSHAWVALITNHTVNVTARVRDQKGPRGLLVPKAEDPNALLLEDLPPRSSGRRGPQVGQLVMTAGFRSGRLDSLYPPGIAIGTVANADANALYENQQVQVSPSADLRGLQVVQILTRPRGSTVPPSDGRSWSPTSSFGMPRNEGVPGSSPGVGSEEPGALRCLQTNRH